MNLHSSKDAIYTEIVQDLQETGALKNHSFGALSATATVVRAFANSVYTFIDRWMIRLQRGTFAHLAERDELIEHLADKGLELKRAVAAQFAIRIGSADQPTQDVPIAQGSLVGPSSESPRFRTLSAVVLPGLIPADSRGSYTVPVDVECLTAGEVGNVPIDAIDTVIDAADGIDVAYNPTTAKIAGQNEESLAAARERYRIADQAPNLSRWTPAWYVGEALTFATVYRAVFVSAKRLGREGEVQILVRGQSGFLSAGEKQDLEDYFADDQQSTGAAEHVEIADLSVVEIDKTVTVAFQALSQIPAQAELDAIAEGYFLSLEDGEAFDEGGLRSLFLSLEGCVSATFSPAGDVSVPDLTVAIAGPAWEVNGVVD